MTAPIKLLLLVLNFPPEIISTGKYNGEMARYFSEHGYDVRVVSTPPYYPQWKIFDGYSGWKYQREKMGRVDVWRCPLWVPHRITGLSRIIHLLSFAISCVPVMLAQTFWKPDMVLCVIPTLFSAPVAWATARLCGATAWLHIHDFELDAASNLGMLPGGRLLRPLAQSFERLILNGFDRVSTITEKMLAHLVEKGVKGERVSLLPNWVDASAIYPMTGPSPLKAELGIGSEKRVVLYHGNLGYKQGLETVIDSARVLEDSSPEILFLLCGDGATRPELERRAAGLSNLRFAGLQPEEKLNALVNIADIHVLPQRGCAADLVMPSKLATMLASGKPVIACAPPDSQLWKVVNEIGVTVPPDEAQPLAEAIVTLINRPEERARLGKLGREYACQYLDRDILLSRFGNELERSLSIISRA